MPDTALLLVGHGTPDNLDDLPAFLSNIRRGRPTPAEVVEEVRRRYQQIGGRSPLLDTTREQARLLSERVGLPVFVAMRMWHPYFDEVLTELSARPLRRVVVIVMAPYSAHVYEAALREAASRLSSQGINVPPLEVAPCWGEDPSLIGTWASLALQTFERLDARKLSRAVLVASAHSLPLPVVQAGDPYPVLVSQAVDAVIQRLGQDAVPHMLAFQSQGMTRDPWLGPDLPTVFERARATGAQGVIVLPLGFLADHVETLYDLDIEARAIAEEMGLWFDRSPCPNIDSGLIDALEALARRFI